VRAIGVSRGDGCGSEASRGGRDAERNDAAAAARVVRDGRSARESTVLEDMEIDEVHAIDVRSCVCVLMSKSCTGFTVLNPAYQIPDRRGRAGVTHGDRDDRGWKGSIKHADIHLRIRILIAEAGRELRTATETIEDGKVANSMVPVLLKWFSGAPPSPGGDPKLQCPRQNN
jgi:hypothetical protein